MHPNKTDFITAKHQNLAYVFKPAKDDLQITESDLSKQLHSSVRTPNLETSLRLLSQGADPNYFHPEKNSTPLSVAGKAGQVCQVELLLVYGADPGATDLEGRTAGDQAKLAGFPGRFVEAVAAAVAVVPAARVVHVEGSYLEVGHSWEVSGVVLSVVPSLVPSANLHAVTSGPRSFSRL